MDFEQPDRGRVRPLRAVVWECCSCGGVGLGRALARERVLVEVLRSPEAVVEAAIHHPPDLIVYEVGTCPLDRGLLRLVRRALPRVPLVVAAHGDSLDARRQAHEFRPIFFAVHPISRSELRQIIRAVSALGDRAPIRGRTAS